MAYHPFTWSKTDGDSSRWPPSGRHGAADVAWHERLAPTDKKYELYETRVGQHIATRLALPGTGHRIHLPDGYALFVHCKPQGDGKVREDVYLFGSKHTLKFRSPNEFLPHVDWLLSSASADDHSPCGCQYNKGSAANIRRLAQAGSSSAAPKRPAGQTVGKEKAKKKRTTRPGSESSDEEGQSGVPLDRGIDLKSQRRFRRGELVWKRIETVTPPEEARRRGAPLITHWPALVSKIAQKSKIVQVEQNAPVWATSPSNATATAITTTATAGSSNGNGNGQTPLPPTPTTPGPGPLAATRIVHYYEYHLRPLGFFSSVDEILTDAKEMLPWLVGSELMGGDAGWRALGEESVHLMEIAAKKEAEAEAKLTEGERVPMTADKRWKKSRYAQRVLFVDMPKEWEFLCPRAALAIKMGSNITASWTQTDMVLIVDPSVISTEDRLAIEQQKKTIYQGLWWGGERIWLEDMVRINKKRSDLPMDQFPMTDQQSGDGCVFMKIRVIALSVAETDPASQTARAWRCNIFGDLFELVPEADAQGLAQPMAQVTMKGTEPLVQTLRAPRGYKYRQLNDADTEVTVDVCELAGRVYPDLLDYSTQSFFADPKATPEQNANREKPGQWVKGLMGLRNATESFNYSDQWREDLYAIIKIANKTVENETKEFYATELSKNGIVIAPSAVDEDAEILKQRGPVPFGTTTTPASVPADITGNGSGSGNGSTPMTLAEASAA